MDEFYRAIEEKIAESGYPGSVDGEAIYDEICDEIEDKENGTLTGGEYDAIMSEKDAIKTSKDAAEFIIRHRRQ